MVWFKMTDREYEKYSHLLQLFNLLRAKIQNKNTLNRQRVQLSLVVVGRDCLLQDHSIRTRRFRPADTSLHTSLKQEWLRIINDR
jgi:hypothetical protein